MDMNKVVQLQVSLRAPKNSTNNFGKYKYRNLESILEAAKPLLYELGLLLRITDDLVMVGDRYYIKATARLFDVAEPEKWIESDGWAREALSKKGMDESQITGSASSYARKIAVGALLLIDDNKDADTLNVNEDYAKPEPLKGLTPEQMDVYNDLLNFTETDPKVMLKALKITGITSENYNDVIRALSKKKAKIMEGKS